MESYLTLFTSLSYFFSNHCSKAVKTSSSVPISSMLMFLSKIHSIIMMDVNNVAHVKKKERTRRFLTKKKKLIITFPVILDSLTYNSLRLCLRLSINRKLVFLRIVETPKLHKTQFEKVYLQIMLLQQKREL